MPEGQFTGKRSKYVYTDDRGEQVILKIDETLVIPTSALITYDPAVNTTAESKPAGFKPRGVYWQVTAPGTLLGRRKFLVAGTPLAGIYASNVPQAFNIDGVAGITTGRRGEVLSYR